MQTDPAVCVDGKMQNASYEGRIFMCACTCIGHFYTHFIAPWTAVTMVHFAF